MNHNVNICVFQWPEAISYTKELFDPQRGLISQAEKSWSMHIFSISLLLVYLFHFMHMSALSAFMCTTCLLGATDQKGN